MSGDRIYELLNGLREDFLLEAEPTLLKQLTATPVRRRPRFHIHGSAVAAVLCCVFAISLYIGMLTGGFGLLPTGPGVQPPANTTETSPEDVTDTPTEPPTEIAPPDCFAGHTVTDWSIDREATCFVSGLQSGTCTICQDHITESFDRLPHTPENGYCSVCGMVEGADERFVIQTAYDDNRVKGGTILRSEGAEGDVIILPNVAYDPESQAMIPVTRLADDLFKSRTDIREVIIPNTVRSIGDNAFDGCTYLKNLVLPADLVEIGDRAFISCTNITSAVLPEGVTSVGNYAFAYCDKITEISVPEGTVTIGEYAFAHCRRLKKASLPNTVTILRDHLFNGCTSLVEITLPNALTHVQDAVFTNCVSLKSISLPDTVTYMGLFVFQGCTSLTSFTYPPQVTQTKSSQFDDCSALTEVSLHDGITEIQNSFNRCTSLSSFHFSAFVEKIDGSAFEGCTNLKNLTVDEANPIYTAQDNCVIHKASKQLIIGGTEAIIPSDGSVTSIGGSAFRGRGCQRMVIPNGIESIGFGAFAECSALKNITFPWTLKEIGDYVFFKCTSLKSISIPFSVTQVGSNLFEGCTSLNTLYLSSNLQEIGDGMLCDCESFSEIHFDGTVAQWQAIRYKVQFTTWEQTCPEFGVICTDGTVVMSGGS